MGDGMVKSNILKDNLSRKQYYRLQDEGRLYTTLVNATGNYEADCERTLADLGMIVSDSRIENIGQNGNDGEHYVDKIARFTADPVHQPNHYQVLEGVEAIDIIRATLSPAEFIGYCKGNFMKYMLRSHKKGKDEDLRKANVYSNWLVEMLDGN